MTKTKAAAIADNAALEKKLSERDREIATLRVQSRDHDMEHRREVSELQQRIQFLEQQLSGLDQQAKTQVFAGSAAAIHSLNRIRAEVDSALHQMCSGYLPSPCCTPSNAGVWAPRPAEVCV